MARKNEKQMVSGGVTQAAVLPARCVVYVMDAYCGWCWGFSARIVEFEAANRHRVPFAAISGGLFTGQRARPISAYPHIPGANARIARLTGAHFGEAYQRVLEEGRLVMNSSDAGAALAALRDLAPQKTIHWTRQLQEAFYERGQSLSEPATIGGIAAAEGFDAAEVLRGLQDRAARGKLTDPNSEEPVTPFDLAGIVHTRLTGPSWTNLAARLAGLAAGMRSFVASVTRARIAFVSSPAESASVIGVDASMPRASARRSVMTSCGTTGPQRAVNSTSRCPSRPSTGSASIASRVAATRTGRRPWNSPRPRLTLVCPQLPNKAELAPVCTSFIPRLSIVIAAIVEHRVAGIIPGATQYHSGRKCMIPVA